MNHFLEIQKWTYAQILEPILALRGREAESTEGIRYAPTPTLPHTYCDDDKLDSAGLMWSQWATWPRGQCVCQTKIYILNEGFPHKWVKTTNLTLLNDFLYFISPENFQGWKTTNTVTPTAKLTVLLMQWSSVWGHISQFDVFDLEGKCIVGKFSAWSLWDRCALTWYQDGLLAGTFSLMWKQPVIWCTGV